MLANLPVELILLICEYPELKDLGQLAWTNKRMMGIIKKHLPMALEREILFYLLYGNDGVLERRICLFDSHNISVEQIVKFTNYLRSYEVATTKDKIFAIDSFGKQFEIFGLNTRQITRGPDPPEWREYASVAYFKDNLYYLGGRDPETWENTNRVDVLIDGKWEAGPRFPLPIYSVQTITCDESLYVIDGRWFSIKIYRLSDDEREWIEVGEIPEERVSFVVASLNGKIYITGGESHYDNVFKSCLCFNPSAPVDSRISKIADMNYGRSYHSPIVSNGKLYAIGGFRNSNYYETIFYNSIEEYDPQTNKWREVGKINPHKILFYRCYRNNNKQYERRICLFNSYTCSVEEIAKFHNHYEPYQVATIKDKIFGIEYESFETYDLDTQQIARGPNPPKWRKYASVAYFKDKLYYLGGRDPKAWIWKDAKRVDVLIDGKWKRGPAFPFPVKWAQTITCHGILYVIDGWGSRKIYRLSDDERKWIEVGKIPEERASFVVASLNGRIYITGGLNYPNVFKSCLCFDPSAPVDRRVSRMADMNYARQEHSLVVANGKLYAIGGLQKQDRNFFNSIEEYDPQTDKWRIVEEINTE